MFLGTLMPSAVGATCGPAGTAVVEVGVELVVVVVQGGRVVVVVLVVVSGIVVVVVVVEVVVVVVSGIVVVVVVVVGGAHGIVSDGALVVVLVELVVVGRIVVGAVLLVSGSVVVVVLVVVVLVVVVLVVVVLVGVVLVGVVLVDSGTVVLLAGIAPVDSPPANAIVPDMVSAPASINMTAPGRDRRLEMVVRSVRMVCPRYLGWWLAVGGWRLGTGRNRGTGSVRQDEWSR